MLDLAKSYDFFQPDKCRDRIHIVGCGSVGATVAENLARFGLTKFSLYDFDRVEPHNIANQIFTQQDIGEYKVDALMRILSDINPDIPSETKVFKEGYTDQMMSGYVFLAVDNIDLRREIAKSFKGNVNVKAMFDFRTRLTDAQHYAADWSAPKMVKDFLASMEFSHDEAKDATPVSACNITLSVNPTVREICSVGVSNFINFVRTGKIKKMILVDTENFTMDAY